MTTNAEVETGEQSKEFTVDEGCILCGGEISFRVTPAGAYSCCVPCRWLARPEVAVGKSGLRVHYRPVGQG
jgi:hypothetical protein